MRLVIRLPHGPAPVQAITEYQESRHRPAVSWKGVIAVITLIIFVGAVEAGTFDGLFHWLVGLFFGR